MKTVTPFEVLVIGAGQIGSRHLQALARCAEVVRVHVFEPDPGSRARALQRWGEAGGADGRIVFLTDSNWPRHCLAAICATPAAGRADVIEKLAGTGIRHLLSEKVLCQSPAEYARIVAAVDSAGIRTAINHIYRYAPAFEVIRALTPAAPLHLEVTAGDNGLGCNLIHFLDLFEYLARSPVTALAVNLDRPFRSSNRGAHYLEFSGSSTAATGRGDRFSLVFERGSAQAPRLLVHWGGHEAIFDEAVPTVTSRHPALRDQPFPPVRVSELSGRILCEMQQGACRLPTFADSRPANQLMLDAFNRAIHGHSAPELTCPIT